MLRYLLDQGADINAVGGWTYTRAFGFQPNFETVFRGYRGQSISMVAMLWFWLARTATRQRSLSK